MVCILCARVWERSLGTGKRWLFGEVLSYVGEILLVDGVSSCRLADRGVAAAESAVSKSPPSTQSLPTEALPMT